MTATQQRALTYRRHLGYLGEITSQQITSMVGNALVTTGSIVMKLPGGQLPGAIIAAAGALTSLIGGLFKPDLTKIQATHIVDQIEAQVMIPMRSSWQALPADQKTRAMQAHYLNVFDTAWNALVQSCSNPALGTAGQACMADRAANSCHWTVDGQTPGVPPNCGNWFVWYRDVVANDPDVRPDPVAQSSAENPLTSGITSLFGGSGGISPLLLAGGALIAIALVVGSD